MFNNQGPADALRPRVFKAVATAPEQVAPQNTGALPAGGGRFFGRQELAAYAPSLEPLTPAEAAAFATGTGAGSPPAGAAHDPFILALRRRAEAVLTEAEVLANQRLADAQARVEEMLSRALAASDRITGEARDHGHQEGFDAGYRAGHQAAQAQAELLVGAAQAEAQLVLAGAEAARATLLQESGPELVRLALAVAEHLLHQELHQRPEAIAGMVAAVLAQTAGERTLTLRVAPADAVQLTARKGELLRRVPGLQELDVVSDSALSPGDFHLQGEHGYVSAALGEQLGIVAAALLQEEPA